MTKKKNNSSHNASNQTGQDVSYSNTPSVLSAMGLDDFKRLRESGEFVDKSLLIKEIFQNRAGVILITRPRRWGKSSNLNMLKTFLEIEVDEQGNKLSAGKKVHSKYFQGGELEKEKRSLEALKISTYIEVMKELGTHPVIMLNFKNINCTSYETIKADLQIAIKEVFENHEYLLQSNQLKQADKDQIQKYLRRNVDTADLQKGIAYLMKYLHIHFKKPVWVLIDEYDNAIYRAYLKFGTTKENPHEFTSDFEEVLDTFRSLLGSALKSNSHLAKGVLTGILKIAKLDLLSDLNNVKPYGVLDKKYVAYYGFTQQEVDDLLVKYQVPIEKKEMIKEWYNGYSYGGLTLYNPWSIMQYVADLQDDVDMFPKNYWSDSGAFGVLQNLFLTDELQAKIQHLLSKPDTYISTFIYANVDLASLQSKNPTMAISLLLFTGYLNPIPQPTSLGEVKVSIPNQEIVSDFGELIMKWSAKKLNIDDYILGEIERALVSGDVSLFKQELKKFLATHTSFRIIKEEELRLKESHYHYLMMGMLSHLHSRYQIFHELESGEGYVDTLLIPRRLLCDKTQAILLEYKYAKNQEHLVQEAEGALAQMNQKGYTSKLKEKEYSHVKQVLKIGIAFHKKEAKVIHEVEKL